MRRLLGLVALVTVSMLGAPMAYAAPVAVPMPNCCSVDEVALDGSVFVLSVHYGGAEHPALTRIDPSTDTVTGSIVLPSGLPQGNAANGSPMTAAAGSIWIVSYFHNEVLRIDPNTLLVIARIGVGRSPAGVVFDGTSVWVVVQHNAALARIDPALDAVVQTVPIGNRRGVDGPWQATFDGSQILVSLPGSGRVAHVDPTRGRVVSYDNVGFDEAACAVIIPAAGGYWLDDTDCASTYYRWDSDARQITAQITPEDRGDYGAVIVNGALYSGQYACPSLCVRGYLVKYNATTGAQLSERRIGSDATLPHFARGSIWVGNWNDGTVVRVGVF